MRLGGQAAAVNKSVKPARAQLDGVIRAHFVAAVAADAFSFVDAGALSLDDGDRVHGAGIAADTTWYRGHMKAL